MEQDTNPQALEVKKMLTSAAEKSQKVVTHFLYPSQIFLLNDQQTSCNKVSP